MATVFRTSYTRYFYNGQRVSALEAKRLQAEGKPVERQVARSKKWYIRLTLPDGRKKTVPGFPDYKATQALAAKLERQLHLQAAGLVSPTELRLQEAIEQHLADFQAELQSRGRTPKHIDHTITRIRVVLEKTGIRTLKDLQAQVVRDCLLGLGLAVQTRNHYLTAIKAFSRWLWRQGRLPSDPLAGLSRWNAEPDRRVRRRALSEQELALLIHTTEESPRVFRGLTGPDRAALYMLAAHSGFRSLELASLTLASLDLDGAPPTVTVEAAYSKHKRQDTVPIPPSVATYLKQWLSSRPVLPGPGVRLWPGTWTAKAAKMLQQDLEDAGIPPETDSGRVDLHALRATYATELARVGVNLQTAQALLRHSDPKLTSKTYTKLGVVDLGNVVSNLGIPQLPNQKQAKAE